MDLQPRERTLDYLYRIILLPATLLDLANCDIPINSTTEQYLAAAFDDFEAWLKSSAYHNFCYLRRLGPCSAVLASKDPTVYDIEHQYPWVALYRLNCA